MTKARVSSSGTSGTCSLHESITNPDDVPNKASPSVSSKLVIGVNVDAYGSHRAVVMKKITKQRFNGNTVVFPENVIIVFPK